MNDLHIVIKLKTPASKHSAKFREDFSIDDQKSDFEFFNLNNKIIEDLLDMISTSNTHAPFPLLRLWQRLDRDINFAYQISNYNKALLDSNAVTLDLILDPDQPEIYQIIGAYLLRIAAHKPELALHMITLAAEKLNYQPAKILLLQNEIQKNLQQGAFDYAIKVIEDNVYKLGKKGLKLAIDLFESLAELRELSKKVQLYCRSEALKYSILLEDQKHIIQNTIKGGFTAAEVKSIADEAALPLMPPLLFFPSLASMEEVI